MFMKRAAALSWGEMGTATWSARPFRSSVTVPFEKKDSDESMRRNLKKLVSAKRLFLGEVTISLPSNRDSHRATGLVSAHQPYR
jgi:hypothetical protein